MRLLHWFGQKHGQKRNMWRSDIFLSLTYIQGWIEWCTLLLWYISTFRVPLYWISMTVFSSSLINWGFFGGDFFVFLGVWQLQVRSVDWESSNQPDSHTGPVSTRRQLRQGLPLLPGSVRPQLLHYFSWGNTWIHAARQVWWFKNPLASSSHLEPTVRAIHHLLSLERTST